MLKTWMTVGALTVLTGGMGVAFARYTHPDLTQRSTLELHQEVISLNRDHCEEPFVFRAPSLVRQQYISRELVRRTREQIRQWQAAHAADAEEVGSARCAQDELSR
jgi:hypothetical protein